MKSAQKRRLVIGNEDRKSPVYNQNIKEDIAMKDQTKYSFAVPAKRLCGTSEIKGGIPLWH